MHDVLPLFFGKEYIYIHGYLYTEKIFAFNCLFHSFSVWLISFRPGASFDDFVSIIWRIVAAQNTLRNERMKG